DPLTPQASGEIDLAQIGRAIILGATFGETGLPDGLFYGLVGEETASSPYYMVGWIGFSCLPVVGGMADIRDAVQAILNGDPIGAAINAAGAIPGPGDGIKITGAIACYTGKFPWKARELGVLLSKELLGPLPDTIKIQVWDLLFDGAGSRLVRGEITPDHLLEMTKRGVDLADVVRITKVGQDAIPLTKTQLDHIVNRHITGTEGIGDPTTLFPTSEPVVWSTVTGISLQYPGTSTLTREEMREKIVDWIDEALRATQSEWPKQPKNLAYSPPDAHQYGIDEIVIGINQKTGVGTFYPSKGPQVFRWYNKKWNPTV
ncbi:hypothetical protein, partial [Methanoculleus sp.]